MYLKTFICNFNLQFYSETVNNKNTIKPKISVTKPHGNRKYQKCYFLPMQYI